MTKQEIKQIEYKLLEMTGVFCIQNLNDEYSHLCEKLVKKLGRKKDVPFQRGKIEVWAASVVYAIGSINFLFDKSNDPYMPAEQISEYFGTNNSTVSSRAREIRNMLKLQQFDPDFSTRDVNESNPFNKMVMVDGCIVPLNTLPEDLQQLVRETRAGGRDIEFTTK